MADIFPVDNPKFRVLPAQDGMVAAFGNTSDENPSGAYTFQFVPDATFTGGFAVVGRTPGISTSDTSVPWAAIPYRRISLADVASDYAFVGDQITGPALIQVPANGLAVGLLIACSAGFAMVYNKHMDGATAP